jgi:hypothetical protein
MIAFEIYKIIHLVGITLTLLGLGVILGGFAVSSTVPSKLKIIGFAGHGFGLILALVGGFGMAARMGLTSGLPSWIYGKLAVWVLLGLGISLTKRKPQWTLPLVGLFAVLVGIATALAVYKP